MLTSTRGLLTSTGIRTGQALAHVSRGSPLAHMCTTLVQCASPRNAACAGQFFSTQHAAKQTPLLINEIRNYYYHRLHFHHRCESESRARSKRKMEGGRDSKRRLTDSGAAAAMAAQTPPTYAPVTHALLPPPHQIAPHPMHCPFRRRSTGRAADSGTGTAASATRSRQPIRLHHLPSFPSTLELVGHYG